jgi:putative transposase
MTDRGAVVTVKRQAQLLDLSRSSVYYQPRPESQRDLLLMRRIDELHLNKTWSKRSKQVNPAVRYSP